MLPDFFFRRYNTCDRKAGLMSTASFDAGLSRSSLKYATRLFLLCSSSPTIEAPLLSFIGPAGVLNIPGSILGETFRAIGICFANVRPFVRLFVRRPRITNFYGDIHPDIIYSHTGYELIIYFRSEVIGENSRFYHFRRLLGEFLESGST